MVANETVEGKAFRSATGLRADDERRQEVRVIAPALNSRLRHWLSDEDKARERAALRLAASLKSLSAAGINADGHVGDADPLQAITDALFEFRAEEIVISTQPERHLHWATHDLVGQIRRRFAQTLVLVVSESSDDAKIVPAPPTRRRASGARNAVSAAQSVASVRTGSLGREGIEANA